MTLVLICVVSCTTHSPETEPVVSVQQNSNKYHNKQGHFSFRVPNGWKEIAADELKEFNTLQPIPFDLGFRKTKQYPYFLIQIRFNRRESKKNIDTYIGYATPVSDIVGIAKHIQDGSYIKRDLYHVKKQFFIMILKYEGAKPILSIMAKKYSSYGYVIIHYYLTSNNSLEKLINNLKILSEVLDSFEYDHGYAFSGKK